MKGVLLIILILSAFLTSCEKVINLDLHDSKPELVIEAVICKDSVCIVNLSPTSGYFSNEEPVYIEDAEITISDNFTSEILNYTSKGIYRGNTIFGIQNREYEINITYNGTNYESISFLSPPPDIISIQYDISEEQNHLNPFGERVVTISCTFTDDINAENFYLIRFSDENNKLIEKYYLLTENESNSGSLNYENGIIRFSESVFYEGDYVEVKVYTVDKTVYDYFLQLTDILFWKRRIMPPTPYNPLSNISNGALGYFSAWSFDSEILILE